MRICYNPTKGLTCTHASGEDGTLYCSNNRCEYKEIDYTQLMGGKHTYKKEHGRIRQRR